MPWSRPHLPKFTIRLSSCLNRQHVWQQRFYAQTFPISKEKNPDEIRRFAKSRITKNILNQLKRIVFFLSTVKPERVSVMALGEVRSAGRPQQFQCETWGSTPPARITWFMDGEPVRHAAVSVRIFLKLKTFIFCVFQAEENVNSTVSVLTYKTAAEDHGRELTCRAENPRFAGSIVEKSMTISVHCKFMQ